MQLQAILVFCCVLLQNNYGATGQNYPYGRSNSVPTFNSPGIKTHNTGYTPQHFGQNYNPNANLRTPTYSRSDDRELYNLRAADARILRNVLQAPEPDTKVIINILAHRSNSERMQIAAFYETTYKESLYKELEGKLTGWFKELILALMIPPLQFYGKQLHDAVSGVGTDEDALTDILCSLTNDEIRNLGRFYELNYGTKLSTDILEDISGDFKTLMGALLAAERDETDVVNTIHAKVDAKKLLDAGKGQWGTDEPVFIAILTQNNYKQIRQIAQEYQQIAGHTLESAIQDEFSGTLRQGLLAILHVAHGLPRFFAERLHASMAGSGTNNKQLIRIITARSEVDMDLIKFYYKEEYKQTLEEAITDDTSGDYKDCLLAIVGGNVFQQTVKF